jgi:streptomycin 6-kinase
MSGIFQPWLDRWGLVPDGEPFETPYSKSHLLAVRQGGVPAMLKIATEPEELRGASVMNWWAGQGAARVLAHEGPALLLERAMGSRSLAMMAAEDDDAAMTIICEALAALHAPRGDPPGNVVPLRPWFAALEPMARERGGIFAQAHHVAEELLGSPRDQCVLHGDMHHDNLLDFGERGWLVIDPKGLVGERGYDYANVFCNPDLGDAAERIATRPGQLARRIEIASRMSGIEPRRLLQWVLAYTGLSASWMIADGFDPFVGLTIAQMAADELGL